jgi:hypothetical protein
VSGMNTLVEVKLTFVIVHHKQDFRVSGICLTYILLPYQITEEL